MKKICIFLVLLSITMSVFAQQGLSVGIRLIPQASGILNKQDFDAGDELNFERTLGFSGGLALGYGFSDNFGLMANLLYSKQGQKYINEEVDPSIKFRTDLGYFKIPLLLRMNTDPYKRAMFVCELGPEFGFLLNAESSSDSGSTDIKDNMNGLDLGIDLHLGAGINFSERLEADLLLRLNYGLSEIFAEEQVNLYGHDKTNNATAGIILGLNYRL